jgi:hypothetical protein
MPLKQKLLLQRLRRSLSQLLHLLRKHLLRSQVKRQRLRWRNRLKKALLQSLRRR